MRVVKSGRKFFTNVPEDLAACIVHDNGGSFSKRGYPDFTIYRKDGSIYGFIEVKPREDRDLKPEQQSFFQFCHKHGIPCIKWSPDEGPEPILRFMKGIIY